MACEEFSLCWDDFQKHMSSGMNSLLANEDFVDVTLAVEGRHLKAHKMVLSVCSLYFRDLFKTSSCKHPIVFMRDISYVVMSDLLQFMYQGEVQVTQENLDTFVKVAQSLQIHGLANYSNDLVNCNNQSQQEVTKSMETEVPRTVHKPIGMKSNVVKTEPSETDVTNLMVEQEVQFKSEPCDEDLSIKNFSDDLLDENIADDTNDYWMMEGGDEEPQAGTSMDEITGSEVQMSGESSATTVQLEVEPFPSVRCLLALDSGHLGNIEFSLPQNSKIDAKIKTRSKNFTSSEVSVLVDEVIKYKHLLFGPLTKPDLLEHHRDKAWERVVARVNAVAPVIRSLKDIKKKFGDLKSRTKHKFIALKKLKERGDYVNDSAFLSAFEVKLMSFIISKNNTGMNK